MKILDHPDQWRRPQDGNHPEIEARVREILERVRAGGEDALRAISMEIDGFDADLIELHPFENYPLDRQTRDHIAGAAERITRFSEAQLACFQPMRFDDRFGSYGHDLLPIERMGAYIPGGRFPLVSTALMTLIPARVAGVKRRVAISPSNHPALLAAASLAGATRFVRLGGAQAIAALAFGTEQVPRVDMIAGPGNAYVNTAKRLVQGRVKIDTLAGPSELLVIADGSTSPEWIAMDLLAQGEHDPMALAICAGTDRQQLERIMAIVEGEVGESPEGKGWFQFILCEDRKACVDFANDVAPEHLHLTWADPESDRHGFRHYGGMFIGPRSAVALGDYCSGPNHTLPTLGFARLGGGLNVGDFLRFLSWQKIGSDHYDEIAETAQTLARIEGLQYHERSLEIRR